MRTLEPEAAPVNVQKKCATVAKSRKSSIEKLNSFLWSVFKDQSADDIYYPGFVVGLKRCVNP